MTKSIYTYNNMPQADVFNDLFQKDLLLGVVPFKVNADDKVSDLLGKINQCKNMRIQTLYITNIDNPELFPALDFARQSGMTIVLNVKADSFEAVKEKMVAIGMGESYQEEHVTFCGA